MSRIYQTEQRKELLSFLSAHPDRQFSIDELALSLPHMGKSTLYRLVKKLTEEGLIRRTAGAKNNALLYQYIDPEHCAAHLHLKCMECGKTIHLPDDFSQKLENAILQNHDFHVNGAQTLFWGSCKDCAEKKPKNQENNG